MGKTAFLGLGEGVRGFLAHEAVLVSSIGVYDALARAERPAAAAPAVQARVVNAGRFGLIGLAELRTALGPRWPSLEERVRTLAESVIGRRLSPGDLFERNEAGDYVVLFAGLDEAATAFRCRAIGREISERLLGSESPRLADVESVSARTTMEALRSGDPEAVLAEAFASGVSDIASDPDHPRSQEDGSVVLGARREPEGASLQPRAAPDPPRWRYVPVWEVGARPLVRFRLERGPRPPTAAELRVQALEPDPVDAWDADLAGLRRALDDLVRLTAADRRLAVVCVLHERSLHAQSRRDRITEVLARTSPLVRRLLSLEIAAAEPEPSFVLEKLLDICQPLGVRCGLALPLGARLSLRPLDKRLLSVALDLPERPDPGRAISAFAGLARGAAAAGRVPVVHGIADPGLLAQAEAAGLQQLSGAAVHRSVNRLEDGFGLRADPRLRSA